MKKCKIFSILAVLVLCLGSVFAAEEDVLLISAAPNTSSFSDVDSEFWAINSIERWKEDGVINGYEDDTYGPNKPITRAEFVAMLDRVFVPTEKADLSGYEDVSANAWYYESLARAVKMGIINGYSETELGPDKLITRQEAMTIIARILVIGEEAKATGASFVDNNEVADWAKEAIALMTSEGYVNGYEDGTIRPNNDITRAEVAKVLDKTFTVVIREAGEYDLGDIEGNVVVVAEDVKIINSNIFGNVYTGPAVDKEKVSLKDSNVKGEIISTKEITGDEEKEEVKDEEKEDNKKENRPSSGGGGAPAPVVNNIIIDIVSGEGKYTFNRTGSNLRLNDKLTVKLNGNVIVGEFVVTADNIKAKVSTIIDALDEDLIIPTVADYKSDSTVKSLGLKVLASVGRTEDEYNDIMTGNSTNTPKAIANRALDVLSVEDLISLANVIAK